MTDDYAQRRQKKNFQILHVTKIWKFFFCRLVPLSALRNTCPIPTHWLPTLRSRIKFCPSECLFTGEVEPPFMFVRWEPYLLDKLVILHSFSGGLPFRWTNCLISQVCPVVLSLPGRQATMHSRVPNSLAILWYTTVRFPVPTTVPGLVGTPGTHFLYQLLFRVHLVPQELLSCTKR